MAKQNYGIVRIDNETGKFYLVDKGLSHKQAEEIIKDCEYVDKASRYVLLFHCAS